MSMYIGGLRRSKRIAQRTGTLNLSGRVGAIANTYKKLTAAAGQLTQEMKRRGIQPKSTLQRKMGPLGPPRKSVSKPAYKKAVSVPVRKKYGRPKTYVASRYTGTFSAPTQKAKPGIYALNGMQSEREAYGTNTMNFCNYSGLSSALPRTVGRDIGVALMRWLMKKHYKQDYSDMEQIIRQPRVDELLSNVTAYNPRFVRFYRETTLQTINTMEVAFTYTFNDVDTLRSFGDLFATSIFCNSSFGGGYSTGSHQHILKAYQFGDFDSVSNATTSDLTGVTRLMAICYLDKQYCKYYSSATITLQNVTVSGGGSSSTDVINANPLIGKIFRMKGLLPKLKDNARNGLSKWNELQMSDPDNDGVLLPTTQPPGSWRAVPNADAFQNCKGYNTVILQPGEIKKQSIKFVYNGLLTDLIQGFGQHEGLGPGLVRTPYIKGGFGTCLLFAFERQLRTGGTVAVPDNSVSIGYHCDWSTGAVITGQGKTVMQKASRTVFAPVDNTPV